MIHQNLNMIWGYTWIILRFKTLFRVPDGIKNIGATARNKHYERWIHYGREQCLNKFSLPLWISTLSLIHN